MKTRHIVTAVVAVAVIAAPGFVIAQGGFGGPGAFGGHAGPGGPGGFGGPGLHRFERMLPRLTEYLGLTAEQQSQIQTILDQELPAIRDLREQVQTARQAYRDSHQPGQFDEPEFRAFAEAQSTQHVEIAVASARTKSRIYNVLTPEQQEQLEQLHGLMGRRGGARRGGKMMRP